MKICFFGVGGVGGYFGTLVAKRFQHEHDIFFIARGAHKEVICSEGLTLKQGGGKEVINVSPKICADSVKELPVCDIIILAVKAYDLPNAAKEIAAITDSKTIILPLLNGVDIYERIREHLSAGIVLPSCVYIGTHIERPGVIKQEGGNCIIYAGVDPGFPDFYPETLISLLKESNIAIDWQKDVRISIWSKFMFIAAFGLVTAAYNKTLGEIMEDSGLSTTTKAIMNEVATIAEKLKIVLSPDIVETTFLKAKQFPYNTKKSFQRDVESKGKINESDLFGGTIIRYGKKLQIPTPVTRSIYDRFMKQFK